jgi:hypothetical protein
MAESARFQICTRPEHAADARHGHFGNSVQKVFSVQMGRLMARIIAGASTPAADPADLIAEVEASGLQSDTNPDDITSFLELLED